MWNAEWYYTTDFFCHAGYSFFPLGSLFHICSLADSWNNFWDVRLHWSLWVSFYYPFLSILCLITSLYLLMTHSLFPLPSGFWPSVRVFLYQIPVVGWIIQYPILVCNINAVSIFRLLLFISFNFHPQFKTCLRTD